MYIVAKEQNRKFLWNWQADFCEIFKKYWTWQVKLQLLCATCTVSTFCNPDLKIVSLSTKMSLMFCMGNTFSISSLISYNLTFSPSDHRPDHALSFIVSGNVTRGWPHHGVMTSDMSCSSRHTDPLNQWNAYSVISYLTYSSFFHTPPKSFFISFHIGLVIFSYWLQKTHTKKR